MTTGDNKSGGSARNGPPAAAPWTIDELAAASEMTIRNVRAHQSRGLLPPPTVRGRVGYYGADHLDRLRTIRQMQDEGFNLSAIASVLAAGHETADRLRRLHPRTLIELDVGPRAELSPEGIAVIRGRKAGAHLDALVDAGVIRELPDGGYAAATPALLAAGRRLNALDIGWERQLVALLALIDLAQQAADGVPKVADELCGADCDDAAVLDEARAWITEVVRAVLDRSIASRVGASRT